MVRSSYASRKFVLAHLTGSGRKQLAFRIGLVGKRNSPRAAKEKGMQSSRIRSIIHFRLKKAWQTKIITNNWNKVGILVNEGKGLNSFPRSLKQVSIYRTICLCAAS